MRKNKRFSGLLLLNRPLGTIDLALLITSILAVIVTNQTVLCFHIVFILLTFGAFFWKFRGFVLRAGFWIPITTAIVLRAILIGQTQVDEIIEIPLLTLIFVQVFVIAGRRSQVEQMRDDLAHMVVHDMKNLIQVISGYSDLLSLNVKGPLNDGQGKLVSRIGINAHNLMDMTTMILDIRRMEE